MRVFGKTVAAVVLLVGGAAVLAQQEASPGGPKAQAAAPAARRKALRRTQVVEAVEQVRDAVVNISSTQIVRLSPFGQFFDLPPDFEPFFGPSAQKVQTAGSGFVLHPAGYIVTNAHVVEAARQPKVTFADGKTYEARVLAVDTDHDLAVLKVSPNDPVKAAVLGTSSDLMIGETAIAIGNPLGFQHTVTAGVVSAVGRVLRFKDPRSPEGIKEYKGLIQTDAAINPGNSGGPLCNILGEVIGINTAIRGDAQNIGFAIPVDQLRKFLPGILDVERINRVTLGVHFEGVGPATVTKVDADSPAEAAGLKVGDTIVAVDGRPVAQDIDFFVEMMEKKPGEDVKLTVLRDGKRHTFAVRLGARPDGAQQAWRKLGMRLRDLSARQAARLGLQPGSGLLIYEVHESGPAYAAGIEPGDILVQIGQTPAKNLESVAEALDPVTSGESIEAVVLRVEQGRWTTRMGQYAVTLKAR